MSDGLDSKVEAENKLNYSAESLIKIISRSNERIDFCYDKTGPFAQVNNELLWNMIAQLKYKGVRLRLITEITKENATYCKTMMRYFDLRHVDGVKGNFGICDKGEYVGNILTNGQLDSKLIHINVESFIELQQYLFDILWNQAIPAKERINEIELGLDKEFLETINDPQETKKILLNLLHSAIYEILVLYSTANSFYRAENEGILHVLKEAVNRGVNVRLLVPSDEYIKKEINEKNLKEKRKQIHTQYIRKPLQANIVTIIVDQTVSLSIEIKNDTRNDLNQSSSAVFSNVDSTVSSCASMFERLWIQSELDKQNEVKHAYFQAFSGLKWNDEVYQKQWKNSSTKVDIN
ncbi:MAG: hypothetical protein KGH76_06190 [Thaumarchaeota archaeon]|nr:hypothetical protein [Nitrososphaerota archaeon]